ncbi:MAG: substrate-binding domain-containing protein [Candidatus Latescibacteria bacterium]|nr:substrate-binding domain-containing protein [Candidatus Latescibacterota bacterium]
MYIVLIIVLSAIASCGDRGEKPVKIGFLVNNPEQTWFQNEWKYARKCADNYGFELVTIGIPDGEKALVAIDNLAAQGVRGFVICPPDVRLGPAIMAKSKLYGLKVFTVDDQFLNHDGTFMDVPYMGISARSIGKEVGIALMAEFSIRRWDINDTAALAVTFDELDTCRERTDGSIEILIESGIPADRIFRAPQKHSDVPSAFDAADVVLTQHPYVKRWLVFSVNDEGVLGAVRALENRGFKPDSIIGIGIGGGVSKSEFEKSEPTGFFATCLLNPYRHGYETTEYVYKWIKDGIEPPKEIKTTGVVVTRETRDEVMKELGLTD